jgi:hypothetical protein
MGRFVIILADLTRPLEGVMLGYEHDSILG